MKIQLASDISLPADVATQTMLVVGKRGSGKSTTGVVLAEQLYRAKVPFAVLDPADVWWGLKASGDGKGPGLGVHVFGGKHADLPLEPTAGALIADVLVDHRISAVLVVKQFTGADRNRFVTDFARRLLARNTEPLHVFLEEAHELAPQDTRHSDVKEECVGAVARLWKLGRSSGLGGSAITQRPASLSKNITTQAEILVVHRLLGPQDVAAVREWIKYHSGNEEILGQLSTLKTGEAFLWAPDFPEKSPIGLVRVRFNRSETFDSRATPKSGERRVEPKELAPVDLETLRERMAATIERAKADDPKELRAQIATLKRDLAAERTKKPEPERIEVPVLDGRIVAELRQLAAELATVGDKISEGASVIATACSRADQPVHRGAPTTNGSATRLTNGHRIAPVRQADSAKGKQPLHQARDAVHRGEGSPDVGKAGLRRMLVALAQRPQGLTNRQLGLRAGVSSKSGTFSTYLSRARSSGWIEDRGDVRVLTDDGGRALGPYEPLPEGAELAAYWINELGTSGAARMLRALVDAYPRGMSNAELGEAAGVSSASGTFSTYLSRLRGLELVTGRGELFASVDLINGAVVQ